MIPIRGQFVGSAAASRKARFWGHVSKRSPAECWEWQAARNDKGYGRVKLSGNTYPAHRVAYLLEHGRDPGPLLVRHRCDNPPCCNPSHLELGTDKDNARDKVERGRCSARPQGGESNAHARLRTVQIGEIVEAFRAGQSNTRIATRYPVSDSLISRIRTGRSWQREAAQFGWQPAIDYCHSVRAPFTVCARVAS